MPRLISFALTRTQIAERTKTETRRLGWNHVKPGDVLRGVDKCMGFKKGEKPQFLNDIKVEKTWREPLNAITQEGVNAEGFPHLTPDEFIEVFCIANKCKPDTEIRVIQFSYL
jgi:hypothetical protein